MIRRLAILALVASAAVASHPVAAQLPGVPFGKWWKRPRIVEQLKLQPEQQERLEEVFSKNRRQFIDLKAELDRRALDVEELMSKKDSDARKVSAAVEALEQAKSRLGKARMMMIVDMKQILTSEQWQMIVDRQNEWREEREEGRRPRRRLDGPGARPNRPGGAQERD